MTTDSNKEMISGHLYYRIDRFYNFPITLFFKGHFFHYLDKSAYSWIKSHTTGENKTFSETSVLESGKCVLWRKSCMNSRARKPKTVRD